jgi:IS5 family transposase
VEHVADLLHGKEEAVWADSGYRGAPSRVERDMGQHFYRSRQGRLPTLECAYNQKTRIPRKILTIARQMCGVVFDQQYRKRQIGGHEWQS